MNKFYFDGLPMMDIVDECRENGCYFLGDLCYNPIRDTSKWKRFLKQAGLTEFYKVEQQPDGWYLVRIIE